MDASPPVLTNNHARLHDGGSDSNLLRIEFIGHVTPDDLHHLVQALRQRLPRVRPGFGVLIDLTHLQKMDLEGAPHIATMMDAFRDARVGKVVRVIPDPSKDIGFGILSLIHYRGQVTNVTVQSLAQAAPEFERR